MRATVAVLIAFLVVPATAWPQGEPLGPEFRINTYTTGGQYASGVASDSSGNFVVVWSGPGGTGGGSGVFGQRFESSGAPLGPEFRVNSYTSGGTAGGRVAVDVDSAGNFIVAWMSDEQDGSFGGIFAQRYESGGGPIGAEFRVNTYTTSHQGYPSVAVAPSGDFVVVWNSQSQDGSGWGVFGQRYESSGSPLGPEFRVNSSTTGQQTGPTAATDASGNFVVTWASDGAVGLWNLFAQRFASSGVPLGTEFQVAAGTQLGTIAADSLGDFVVTWSFYQPGAPWTWDIYARRFASSGVPLGDPFRVNTYTTEDQIASDVSMDASGNFVIVWHSEQDGSGFGIFGQRYAGTGEPLGPEFRVNTQTGANQGPAFVAADPIGNFVVVWLGAFQDGSDNGVFGQRYGRIVPVELMGYRVE